RRHTRSKREWSSDVCSSDLLVRNHYICNYKTISRQAQQLLDARGYHPIFVAQGYANCSVAVVDEHSIITADCGIARACRAAGLRSEERRVGKESRSRYWGEP